MSRAALVGGSALVASSFTGAAAVATPTQAGATAVAAEEQHGHAGQPSPHPDDLGRQVLPDEDGWASAEGGTTGGAAASADQVFAVTTRDELARAVDGDEPKIVYVTADIDANTRYDGTPIRCADYATDGYSLEAYLDAYDPAHWDGAATGPLEDARKASAKNQREQIRIDVGANTTIVGVGDVTMTGFTVNIDQVDNVIVRNLHIADAYDCFPGWNGDTWKTEWDNLVVSGATHVWLDHLTLDDGDTVDSEQPEYFGQRFLRHDGLLDVVRQADLVTISWSRLEGHDKSLLWGNGDGVTADRGKLRVTLHHNQMTDLLQRAPRVRFGQAHVYNNVYRVTDPEQFQYSWGAGVESSIIARNNVFELAPGLGADRIIRNWGGTAIDESGTWVNGRRTDVLTAYNAANPDAPLGAEVTGTAGPHLRVQHGPTARAAVERRAGAGVLSSTAPRPATADGLLRTIGATDATTADGPVWAASPTGFASTLTDDLPRGTTGGVDGPTVTARTLLELRGYAAAPEPLTILVRGSIDVDPFGSMIDVASDKTIVGVGPRAEIVGGGFFLDGVHNVIVRNLTFRDSYVPGDWDGKSEDNDNDGIRIDSSSHVWIDHNEFARLGDGLVDVRKDSTAVTLSWNVFRDHNKTVGVGWTDNVVTTITMHHNLFQNTYQRNASIDNVAAGHVYNNYFRGTGHYGTMSRGASQLVVESNVYEDGEDPVVAKDPASRVDSRDNVFDDTRGRKDHTGPTFDPASHYFYAVDNVRDVPRIVPEHAGTLAKVRPVPRRLTVALDGTGDYASVGAALGAAADARRPVDIVVEPGVYREVVRVWDYLDGTTIRGATGDPEDVVITYDLAAGQAKFYGGNWGHTGSPTVAVLADDVTVSDLTIENAYDEAANGPSQALALRTAGDRIVLDDVRLLGNQDTFFADSADRDTRSRVYVTDSYVEGDVDFVYGRGTAVFDGATIRSLDRGLDVNGYVAAPATVEDNPYGFLFVDSTFVSDAAPGTVFLGRPWHPSSQPATDPAVVIRDSWLGEHIATPAWSDMSGHAWQNARLYEHDNEGPGAATGEGRPQLDDAGAAGATVAAYLAGDDGWSPQR